MRKTIFILTLLLGIFMNAQNQRFIYEYRFVKDSTKKHNAESAIMYLDVAKKGSKFYNRNNFVADSITNERVKSGNFDLKDIKVKEPKYTIEKNYPDYKVLYFNIMDAVEYKVSDDRKINWQILPDKEKIGELNAQKAVGEFAGRKWIAWFVSEIPIQDGPYKFHGLPGLIIKIEDTTSSHIFILKAIKKLKENEVWKSENNKERFEDMIALDPENYKKHFIENRKNPTRRLGQWIANNQETMLLDRDGKEVNPNEMIRRKEKEAREENARNNNILELDLLQ